MNSYSLQQNEVVLYESNVSVKGNKGSNQVLLTNLNIVIENTIRKMFQNPEINTVSYPTADIKVYNEQPQIKQKEESVTVYLLNSELTLKFETKAIARKFVGKVIELVTGKSISVRGADKFKSAIGFVDDTLGIDTRGTISSVMENGVVGAIFGGTKKKSKAESVAETGKTIKAVASATTDVIQAVTGKPIVTPAVEVAEQNTKSEITYDERIESVKKLKELLDMGIISQEEFDTKKKELLKL